MGSWVFRALLFGMVLGGVPGNHAMDEESLDLQTELARLEWEDKKDEQKLNVLLDQKPLEKDLLTPEEELHFACQVSLLKPQAFLGYSISEDDPELQEALLLSFINPEDKSAEPFNHPRPIGEWRGMEEALAASFLSTQEEEKKERRKKVLVQNILEDQLQFIVSYKDHRIKKREASGLLRKMNLEGSFNFNKAEEEVWKKSYAEQLCEWRKLRSLYSQLVSMMDTYLKLQSEESVKEEGKNLEQEFLNFYKNINDLNKNLEQEKDREQKAFKLYAEFASDETEEKNSKKQELGDQWHQLKKEVANLEIQQVDLFNENTGLISAYFEFIKISSQ